MDMSDYKISNNKVFRYIIVIIDIFSKHNWCIRLRDKHGQTLKYEFSNIIKTSKRKPNKLESDPDKEFNNTVFQNLLKLSSIHH